MVEVVIELSAAIHSERLAACKPLFYEMAEVEALFRAR